MFTEESEVSTPSRQPESNRNQSDRIGALEQDMKVVKHRLDQFDRRHESAPERLTKLEQEFAHQTEKLDEVEMGIGKINASVDRMGHKIPWGIGARAAFMVMFDKVWPFLAKGFGG